MHSEDNRASIAEGLRRYVYKRTTIQKKISVRIPIIKLSKPDLGLSKFCAGAKIKGRQRGDEWR